MFNEAKQISNAFTLVVMKSSFYLRHRLPLSSCLVRSTLSHQPPLDSEQTPGYSVEVLDSPGHDWDFSLAVHRIHPRYPQGVWHLEERQDEKQQLKSVIFSKRLLAVHLDGLGVRAYAHICSGLTAS